MAAAVEHSGVRVTLWAAGGVLCGVCAAWSIAQMAQAGGASAGLLAVTLFWGAAAVRAVEYALAARRGDAHVGHRH